MNEHKWIAKEGTRSERRKTPVVILPVHLSFSSKSSAISEWSVTKDSVMSHCFGEATPICFVVSWAPTQFSSIKQCRWYKHFGGPYICYSWNHCKSTETGLAHGRFAFEKYIRYQEVRTEKEMQSFFLSRLVLFSNIPSSNGRHNSSKRNSLYIMKDNIAHQAQECNKVFDHASLWQETSQTHSSEKQELEGSA